MRRVALCLCLLIGGCTLPTVVASLEDEAPPPALGRPGWVRAPASAGAWIGGAVGAVASIVTLPITWPIAQLADEPLGWDKEEFTWAPVSIGGSAGHFLLGAPFDGVDWVFRRAWVADAPGDPVTPQPPPIGPMEPPPFAPTDG